MVKGARKRRELEKELAVQGYDLRLWKAAAKMLREQRRQLEKEKEQGAEDAQ